MDKLLTIRLFIIPRTALYILYQFNTDMKLNADHSIIFCMPKLFLIRFVNKY